MKLAKNACSLLCLIWIFGCAEDLSERIAPEEPALQDDDSTSDESEESVLSDINI